MKPLSWDKQLGLASPLECAAIQSGQDQNPLRREKGLDANHHIHVSPGGRGRTFFLTSSLIGQLTRRGWPSKNLVRSVKESLLDSQRTANECRACIDCGTGLAEIGSVWH